MNSSTISFGAPRIYWGYPLDSVSSFASELRPVVLPYPLVLTIANFTTAFPLSLVIESSATSNQGPQVPGLPLSAASSSPCAIKRPARETTDVLLIAPTPELPEKCQLRSCSSQRGCIEP